MTEEEKKVRIEELLAELKQLRATPRSDWHTAFEAFLRFATYKYKTVKIRPEEEIGIDAPRADYIILIEDENVEFEEVIFKIFRKINVIEYKNPYDSLNKRVIHKICGYAHLLIGTAEHEGDVPEDEVTISIFRAVKNPELFKKMEKEGSLVKGSVPGIYLVKELTDLPFQIVITSELEGDEYAACRALTDKANEIDIERVIKDSGRETDSTVRDYYRIFLDLIAEKNPDIFHEIRRNAGMRSALMEIMREDVDEEKREQEQQITIIHIKDIMESFGVTVEKAMDSLKIPQTQRETYAGLVKKSL